MDELEQVYSRIVFYNTLYSTYKNVDEVMCNIKSGPANYCAWINHRVFNNCSDNNTNSTHVNTLNRYLCGVNVDIPDCVVNPTICRSTLGLYTE